MPDVYPLRAAESMQALAPYIPSDADWIVFGSYGSLAEMVQAFFTWGLVDAEELGELFDDLGTHYHLNPSLRSSYFKAGLDTSSGFSVFGLDDNVVVLLRIDEPKAFDAWWDNFVNEEFGRPRYHPSTEEVWRYAQVNVLNRDLATLAHGPDKTSFLVFGPAFLEGSAPSLEKAKEIVNASDLLSSDLSYQAMSRELGQAPLAIFSRSGGAAMSRLTHEPMALKALNWVDALGLELAIDTSGIGLRAIGAWAETSQEVSVSPSDLAASFGGTIGPWGQAIAATAPKALLRLSLQTQPLEACLLPMLDAKLQSQWQALKSKLEQKLLGLQFSEQVVYNLEGLWIGLWDLDLAALEMAGADPLAQVGSQSFAIFLPFKDHALAHRFFGKIKILKRFIPPEMAEIQEDGELLSMRIERAPYPAMQVAYTKGVLAVATVPAWPKIEQILKERPEDLIETELLNPKHVLGLSLDMAAFSTYLGAQLPILSEQIAYFLDDFDDLTLAIDLSAKFVAVNLRLALKHKEKNLP